MKIFKITFIYIALKNYSLLETFNNRLKSVIVLYDTGLIHIFNNNKMHMIIEKSIK